MMRPLVLALALLSPFPAMAGEVTVSEAFVPLAPPGAMTHAAYFTLTNSGDAPRRLIGVRAEGYGMAHLHRSEEVGGVATMSAVDAIDIAPGQSVDFAPGGLHVMLMHPEDPQSAGGAVDLTLSFEGGETLPVRAEIREAGHGA